MHTIATCITLNKQLGDKNFTLQRSTMSLIYKKCSLVEVIYLLIRFTRLNSSCETQRMLIEMV